MPLTTLAAAFIVAIRMRRDLSEALTLEVLDRAGAHWGMAPGSLRLIRNNENAVYESTIGGQHAVLRLTHDTHRSLLALEAELEFIRSLAAAGLPACIPISTPDGTWVEPIAGGFSACCFQHAPGSKPNWRNPLLWNERTFLEWGRVLASFHRQARTSITPGSIARHRWDRGDLLVTNHLTAADADIFQRLQDLVQEIQALPADPESFGMIHADFHQGNFLASPTGTIAVYDFDDCSYHWFTNDLAVIWYHLPEGEAVEPPRPNRRLVMETILTGYEEVRPLPRNHEREMPLFLLMRDLHMYQALHRNFVPEDRSAWWKSEISELAQRIRRKVPRNPFSFS
jgi:Ser/Thr protein kinase RdoA (MazF antagonist)